MPNIGVGFQNEEEIELMECYRVQQLGMMDDG